MASGSKINKDHKRLQEGQKVSIADIAAKMESKHEIYQFLTTELQMYLPKYKQTSIYWMREIIAGKRKCKSWSLNRVLNVFYIGLKAHAIKHHTVPYYENLTVKQMKEKWCKTEDVEPFLPPPEDFEDVPRQWLINVIFTKAGERFSAWVKEERDARNAKMKAQGRGEMEMDPEIYAAFKASTLTSSKWTVSLCFFIWIPYSFPYLIEESGVGADMLKPTVNRRRGKQAMKDAKKVKELEDKINAENAEKAQQLEAYKAMVAAKEAELVIARNFRDEAIARGLY